MADIFISYARADRDKIEKLAAALETEGFSVWWDRNLESGAEFSKDIERELDEAKAVIVCWSEAGVQSRWVKDEATIAAEAGKLKTISLDGAKPPIGYMQYHALDLSNWTDGINDPAFQHLVSDAKAHLSKLDNVDIGVVEASSPMPPSTENQKTKIGDPKIWFGLSGAIALIVIVGMLVMRGGDKAPASQIVATEAGEIDRSKSIAVLPFADFSPENDHEWFSDGLTEEILNSLARTPDLLVASRTSSFKYKDADEEIPVIAKNLGVEHVLEGSVRRSGDRLRVTAQLIRASDGFHLWSQNYDHDSDDVIAIQEDIAIEIAKALKTAMDPNALAEMVSAGTRSVEAYEAYLEGLALRARASSTNDSVLFSRANDAFDRARAIDPQFAEAHADAAIFWMLSMILTAQMPTMEITPDMALQNVMERIDLAVAAQPDKSRQSQYRSMKALALGQFRSATEHLGAYISVYPNDLAARDALTSNYVLLGDYQEGLKFHRETEAIFSNIPEQLGSLIDDYVWLRSPENAARLSRIVLAHAPEDVGALYQAQRAFLWAGAKEEAHQAAVKYRRLDPTGDQSLIVEVRDACAAGDRPRAERAAEQIIRGDNMRLSQKWHAYNLLGRIDEANRLIADLDRATPPNQIAGFLPFPFFDAERFPNLSDILEREGVNRPPPVEIPFACPSADEYAANENSIAVMPFVALSDDASDEYFGKGVAEELLNALAQLPELKVAARTSAFSFEGQNIDLREVGQSLEVAHVLEGSVRRAGDRLRITAQLIRVSDGFHIWSETYERELTDVFAIQDEIVEELSRNLQLRLGVGGGAGRASAKSVDPRAYEQYLRGLYLWGSRDTVRSNRPDALKALQRAVEFDPGFAEAWGAIGIVGAFSDPNSLSETADEFVSRTEAAFERALALDSDNVTAHIGLAPWHANYKVDIEKARHHLDRALALAPNRAEAQYAAALYWGAAGDDAAMFRAFDRAIALDPLNNAIQRIHAQMQVFTGRDDAAFAYLDDCREKQCMDPRLLTGGILLAAVLTGDEQRTDQTLIEFDALMGTGHNLREIADVILERENNPKPIVNLDFGEPGHPNFFGIVGPVIAKTADEDALFNTLEQLQAEGLMFSEPYGWAPYFGANPYPDWVLRHPRYHALWERPGMRELAVARRANGQSAGLPLPREQVAD